MRVLDSYAHHPTELAADLAAARDVAAGGRVIAVFQPHLFSRTRIFAAEFGAALGLADEVLVLDVYAAREDPEPGVTGQLVASAVPGGRAQFVPDRAAVPGRHRRPGQARRPGPDHGRGRRHRARPADRRRAARARRASRDDQPPRIPAPGRRPGPAAGGPPPSPASRPGAGRARRAAGRAAAAGGRRGAGPWRAAFLVRAGRWSSWPGRPGRCSARACWWSGTCRSPATARVPAAEVSAAAGSRPGTPLARVNTAAAARRVERIPQVLSAQVSRYWPDTVVITVRERTPQLAVAAGGGFELVDKYGVVVRPVAARPAGLPLLTAPPAPAARQPGGARPRPRCWQPARRGPGAGAGGDRTAGRR